MNPLQWLKRQSSPVTFIIIGLIVFGGLSAWVSEGSLTSLLSFNGKQWTSVWTWFTYPYFIFLGPFATFFLALWLYSIGGATERDHGSRNFLLLWLVLCLLGVLPLALWSLIFGGDGIVSYGALIPVTMLTVIWGTRRPNATVMCFGLIPVAAKWIAMLSVLSVFFVYASRSVNFPLGMVSIAGCLLAYLYAKNKIPRLRYGLGYGTYSQPKPTKKQVEREARYFENVYEREKEREERERLRKLFESSLDEEK